MELLEDVAAPLSKLDADELDLLRAFRMHAPARLTRAAWRRLYELEDRVRQLQRQHEAELQRRWARTLTRAKVAELERKSKSGENMTQQELEQWSVAVDLSQREVWSEQEWKHWYERPVAVSLFQRRHTDAARQPMILRPQGRRTRSSRRTSRRRSGAVSADEGSDEPDASLAARPCIGCGRLFVPSRPNNEYHSEDCRALWRKRNYRAQQRERAAAENARTRKLYAGEMISLAMRECELRSYGGHRHFGKAAAA